MFSNFFGAAAFVTFWLSVACFCIGLYGIAVIGIILAVIFAAVAIKADKTLS
ncbi:hypothetical protein N9M78_06175 [Alphaproteobacteria bacterium]|nr:hypothetical protein [Alphaproteobacteria bacterium]